MIFLNKYYNSRSMKTNLSFAEASKEVTNNTVVIFLNYSKVEEQSCYRFLKYYFVTLSFLSIF